MHCFLLSSQRYLVTSQIRPALPVEKWRFVLLIGFKATRTNTMTRGLDKHISAVTLLSDQQMFTGHLNLDYLGNRYKLEFKKRNK